MTERWHTLNFEGSDDTHDGTGLDPRKIASFLSAWKGPQLTIGLVMFPGISPQTYLPFCQQIRGAGHKVMLRVCDSFAMAHYTVLGFEHLHARALRILGNEIDYVECANEVCGSRGDDKWPGTDAAKQMNVALDVWKSTAARVPRVVTLFWNNDDPQWTWDWALNNPFESEIVLMSDYPRSVPLTTPTPVNDIIQKMADSWPKAQVGIGEYGCQNAKGKDDASTGERTAMIQTFETRPQVCPQDIGGGFFWDSYEWLVKNQSGLLLKVFQSVWR